MIRSIIFDFNGVLIDDEHVHFSLFRDVLAEEGISFTERQYHEEYLGYDDRECFEVALSRSGRSATSGQVQELIQRKAVRYVKVAENGLRVFPGAIEAVRSLSAVWPIAICSGALRGEIEFALDRFGLRATIDAIVAAEDTERGKPDPEGYELALDALRSAGHEDLEAGHCLVIEDSQAGIAAAKAAGMWAVGITNTYPAEVLRRAGADAILTTLEGVGPDWARRLFTPEVSP